MYFFLSDLFYLLKGLCLRLEGYSLFDFDIYVLVPEMNRTIILKLKLKYFTIIIIIIIVFILP